MVFMFSWNSCKHVLSKNKKKQVRLHHSPIQNSTGTSFRGKKMGGFKKLYIIWALINYLTSFPSTFPPGPTTLTTLACDVLDISACLPLEVLHWRFLLPFLIWLHMYLFHFFPAFAHFHLLKETKSATLYNAANFPMLPSRIHLRFFPMFLFFFPPEQLSYSNILYYLLFFFLWFYLYHPEPTKMWFTLGRNLMCLFIDIYQASRIVP